MFTTVFWFCAIGMVLSLVGMFTTKPVSEWIAPNGPGFWSIPRTLLSVMWFAGGQIICVILLLVFAMPLVAML